MSVRIGASAAATVAEIAAKKGSVVLTEGDKRGSVVVDDGKTTRTVNMRGKVAA